MADEKNVITTDKTDGTDVHAMLAKDMGNLQNLDGVLATAFHGYKKEAVREYVNAMAETARAEKENLQETNRQLKEKNDSLREELRKAVDRYNQLYAETQGTQDSQSHNLSAQESTRQEKGQKEKLSTAEIEKRVNEAIHERELALAEEFENLKAELENETEKKRKEIAEDYSAKEKEAEQKAAMERESLEGQISDLKNTVETFKAKYNKLRGNYQDYVRAKEKTLGDVNSSLRSTENQLHIEEKALETAKTQLKALQETSENGEMAKLKEQITKAREQIADAAEREKLQKEAYNSLMIQKNSWKKRSQI